MVAQKNSEEVRELWRVYNATHSDESRNELILLYLPLVTVIANKMKKSLANSVTVDTLISSGSRGLMDAIKGFDMSLGVSFATYSARRIFGAIYDEIREIDHAPRLARRRQKRLKKAREKLTLELCRSATDDELQAEMGLSPENFLNVSALDLGLQTFDGNSDSDGQYSSASIAKSIVDHRAISPEREQQRKDLKKVLVKGMNRTERLIVLLYYDVAPLTMREIGKALGLSESRVSQMHSALIQRLRRTMSARREEFVFASDLIRK